MKIRGVRGGAILRKVGPSTFAPTPMMMKKIAQIILDTVVDEAKRDMMKGLGITGGKAGLPRSEEFLKSFYYKIDGENIEIISDWPTAEALTEGRPPFPMWWLTKEGGTKKVPMRVGGNSVVRSTPITMKDAWIHPGFHKYTFLERGARKGREKAIKMLVEDPRFFQDLLFGGK